MRVLRLIYGVTLRDKVRNDIIRSSFSVESILNIIERNQLRWFGHVLRMPEGRDTNRIYNWKPKKRRPPGRPRKRWEDQIREITQRERRDFEEVKNLTQDKVAWRNLTQRLTTDRPEGLQASG
ncbi:hypothetical protein Bbelb_079780 [Branchiostoma belcheri]|nr:hypothetical protein Bbelb_079780 [Branchiostoma belcheri]